MKQVEKKTTTTKTPMLCLLPGVGVATVHSENEKMLAKKVGIRSLPTMVLLMEGKTTIYREPMISAHKIVGKCGCIY